MRALLEAQNKDKPTRTMTEQAQRELGRTLWNIADKLAALKTHEQGLMQQLFPDLQESAPLAPLRGEGPGVRGRNEAKPRTIA